MNELQNLQENFAWFIPVLIIASIWSSVWKIIAMWKSARNNHIVWFIAIAVINSLGILPIIYILLNRKKEINENI